MRFILTYPKTMLDGRFKVVCNDDFNINETAAETLSRLPSVDCLPKGELKSDKRYIAVYEIPKEFRGNISSRYTFNEQYYEAEDDARKRLCKPCSDEERHHLREEYLELKIGSADIDGATCNFVQIPNPFKPVDLPKSEMHIGDRFDSIAMCIKAVNDEYGDSLFVENGIFGMKSFGVVKAYDESTKQIFKQQFEGWKNIHDVKDEDFKYVVSIGNGFHEQNIRVIRTDEEAEKHIIDTYYDGKAEDWNAEPEVTKRDMRFASKYFTDDIGMLSDNTSPLTFDTFDQIKDIVKDIRDCLDKNRKYDEECVKNKVTPKSHFGDGYGIEIVNTAFDTAMCNRAMTMHD